MNVSGLKKISSYFSRNRIDILISLLLISLLWIFKYQHLFLPYYWDETIYIHGAHSLHQLGWACLNDQNVFVHNPPGMHAMLVLFWKLTGESTVATKLFCLILSSVAVVYVYRIGKLLLSKTLGIVVASCLIFAPMFLAQSSMFVSDTIFLPFAIMFQYYFLRGSNKQAIVCGLLMGTVRPLAVLFIPGAILYLLLTKQLKKVSSMLAAVSPAVTVSLFYLYEKISTGLFFNHPAIEQGDFALSSRSLGLWKHLIERMFEMSITGWGRSIYLIVLLSSLLIILLITLIKTKKLNIKLPESSIIFLSANILFFMIYLLAHKVSLPRYFMAVLPLYICVSLFYFVKLFRKFSLGIIILIYLIFMPFDEGILMGASGKENSLEHIEVISVYQQAAKYVDDNYESYTKILSSWPFDGVFPYPYQGYVSKPYLFTENENESFDLFVWSNYSSRWWPEHRDRIVKKHNLKVAKRFDINGKKVEIFVKPL